ncbi:MAG TPA: alpha/beta fold hydrolase, partial [Gemmatimonadaceae bacterium]|nr:alpha/beta fold hydrolase [Gemmatimonadaceae bacterium]
MIRFVRRGRLSPGEMFPAGDPAYRVSYPRLRSGIKVRVVERGDPAAPPVLFVPGWGCPVYVYRRNLPAVADAGFRSIAVDLKGHGLSFKPLGGREYSLESLVDHFEEIIDSLELERPALVGHSIGATLLYH